MRLLPYQFVWALNYRVAYLNMCVSFTRLAQFSSFAVKKRNTGLNNKNYILFILIYQDGSQLFYDSLENNENERSYL